MNNQKLTVKVNDIITKQIEEKAFATMEDTLLMMGWLEQKNYLAWRHGKIDYLERVCHTNLSKLTFLSKIYHKYAILHNYKLSYTVYCSTKQKKTLRFSKYGKKDVERNYAMHIVKPKEINSKNEQGK